ncbi:putative receptor-like protein kinase At3g47110 [Mercurialis annua]|uniref:putative receptor-like protein kinase At3g47110 n=1 Tax=Mercurialis annua TaxID=3986 RepID=UPI0024ACC682|nr:putative receptor-like protein kinase At3g47110 [Mercurialis annua]
MQLLLLLLFTAAYLCLCCFFMHKISALASRGLMTSASFTCYDFRIIQFVSLIYEFMDNGNLDDWFHPTYPKNLNIDQKLNIVIDVASALEYLHNHSGTLPIVLCDLKPSNVLLYKEMTAHVGDFWVVKFLSLDMSQSSTHHTSSREAIGTIGYCPPEYGLGTNASTSGDVFSFGILLLEMFTGKRLTDDIFKDGLSLHKFVKRALPEEVIQIMDPNMQLREDATSAPNPNMKNNVLNDCLILIFQIGVSCSFESPQERLDIDDAVIQLSSIREQIKAVNMAMAADNNYCIKIKFYNFVEVDPDLKIDFSGYMVIL